MLLTKGSACEGCASVRRNSEELRQEAIRSLGLIGSTAKEAVSLLIHVFKEGEQPFAQEAAAALKKICKRRQAKGT